MEKISIFDEVKTAIREKEKAGEECARVEGARDAEKEKAVAEIEKKYADQIKVADDIYDEKAGNYFDACGRLYDAGLFTFVDLVPQVAILMSYVEGDRYIPAHSNEAHNNTIIALASEVNEDEDVSKEKLEDMYNSGSAIMLGDSFSPMVELYNHAGEPYSQLGYYNYVREFLESLIEYRARNNLKWFDVKVDGVNRFMGGYLFAHPALVSIHKDKRETMLQGEQDECTRGCIRLEKIRKGEIVD